MKRGLAILLGLFGLWLVALVIIGRVYAGKMATRVTDRVGESLQATATVDSIDLALVRGRLDLEQLAVHRDDIGHLAITIAEIRCDLPVLGYALVDGDCRELAVRGTKLEVSTAALFQLRNAAKEPIRARHVVIDDAVFEFSPSALVPGLGRIAIHIDHAEAGATVFKTPLSWLFALTELRSHIELPAGIAIQLGYHDGKLSASGSLFGAKPVELPVDLPIAELGDDARAEMAKLVKLGTDLADKLVSHRVEDWVKSKLSL
jgi:hypothetical protein